MVFATVLGMNPMTIELILRYLAKAGLVPHGQVGKRSAHYFAVHFKNLILALAGAQPLDAVEAVQILNDLRCNTNALLRMNSGSVAPVERGMSFGDWIVQEIEARIVTVEADRIVIDPEDDLFLEDHRIGMSLAPARAWNMRPYKTSDINSSSNMHHFDHFAPVNWRSETRKEMPVLTRQTIFSVELLIAAGALLADTLAAQVATSIPDPAPGRAGEGDDATPETTKAAGPGSHDGPQLEHPATQTRRHALLNKAQPIASQGRKQSCPDGAVSKLRGFYPSAAKDHYNGTLWTDTASP